MATLEGDREAIDAPCMAARTGSVQQGLGWSPCKTWLTDELLSNLGIDINPLDGGV